MSPIFRCTALLVIPFIVQVPWSARLLAQNTASLRIRALTESIDQNPPDQNALLVEVTDAQGAPVPDAAVTFRLPEEGPGATFADGSRAAVVNTDRSGRALVSGIHWTAPGTASIRVTAAKGTAHAGILLEHQPSTETRKAAAKLAPVAVLPTAPEPMAPRPTPSVQRPPSQPKPGVATATPIAAPQFPAATTPAIEPPHVSITTVSRKQIGPAQASRTGSAEPNVVITGAGERSHTISKKWIILAAIAAGAGAGAVVMLSRGKSSSATTAASNSGVSISAPTISIGAP